MANKIKKYVTNKTVYITGGASGLGLETAKQLAKYKLTLVLFDIGDFSEALQKINAVKTKDTNVITQKIDITDAQMVTNAVNNIAKQYPPNISFHYAGITGPWAFDDMEQAQFEKVVKINLFGTRNWLAAIRPHLKKGSHVMVTASMAAFVGSYGYSSYSASKFGVWGMMQSIRTEWKPKGIHVSVFAPPHIDSPLTEYEKGVMDKAGLLLKKNAGSLDKQVAIHKLLTSLPNKPFLIVPGKQANLLRYQLKFLPQNVINTVTDAQMKLIMFLANK